jgi:DNA polymerase II small subunit/DNA polymerase delta subunit B
MKPLHDYFYRFPSEPHQVPGRCRVRIYRRKNGTHTVLLTELDTNAGESIASACERIATNLTVVRGLNPKTTRWIQHDLPQDDLPQVFEELQFSWDDDSTASDPQWQRIDDEQVEALTGASLDDLERRLGDPGPRIKEETERVPNESIEAQGTA